MPEEDMQRTLCSEFGPLGVQYNAGLSKWVLLAGGGDYEEIASSANSALYVSQVDIDLSGYALEKKTFYPYSSFDSFSHLAFVL